MGAAARERLTPAERRLLAACLLARRPAGALARLAAAGIDWDRVLAAAADHAVAEALAHALHEDGVVARLPPGPRAAVQDLHQNAAAKNALLLHDLARVQALLDAAAVPSVALKGAALVAAHYPAPAARHVGDIDLLVLPQDLAAAAAVLARAGLVRPASATPPLDGGEGPGQRNATSPHLLPVPTWGGLALELHDRLPGGGPAPAAVLARARPVDWQGRRLRLPAPDDLAGMICAHVFAAHADDWRYRTRHVADLYAIEATSGAIDWEQLRIRYGDRPARESRALLEAAREEAAGGPRAPRRLGLLGEPGPWAQVVGGLRARPELVRAWESSGPGAALKLVFPSRRYMEARYRLRPGSPLVPLLYPWRLGWGLLRRVLSR